jgi:hypothetical protein
LTYTFISTSNSATSKAVGRLLTSTPGISVAIKKTANAVDAIRIRNFIFRIRSKLKILTDIR